LDVLRSVTYCSNFQASYSPHPNFIAKNLSYSGFILRNEMINPK